MKILVVSALLLSGILQTSVYKNSVKVECCAMTEIGRFDSSKYKKLDINVERRDVTDTQSLKLEKYYLYGLDEDNKEFLIGTFQSTMYLRRVPSGIIIKVDTGGLFKVAVYKN